MEKKTKKLLILLGILLVLSGILFGICFFNEKKAERQKAEKEAEKIYVTDLDEISEIRYDVGNGVFTFEKKEDIWIYMEDSDFPLKQSIPKQIADTFGSLEAERELKDADAPEDYGLDQPIYTVSLTTVDGNTATVEFGDTAGDCYYVKIADREQIYTVTASVLQGLQYTLNELAQFDEYPDIGSGNLAKETITEKGKTTIYDSDEEEDVENIAAVAGGLGAVTLDEAADYSVSDENLSKYGLDEDMRITVKAVYTEGEEKLENELILYIGKENGSDKRYVMMNDSRIVYLVPATVCDNILNVPDEQTDAEKSSE